jgi:peptidoglycan DL-endopeptidase CwlO
VSTGLSEVQARVAELRGLLGLAGGGPPMGGSAAGASGFAGALATVSAAPAGAPAAAGNAAAALGGDLGNRAVVLAAGFNGVPYRWGGTDPASGLDCSGLVQLVYGKLGVTLPRVAADQSRAGAAVASLDQAQPGDLVFFGVPAHHVGIYVGDGKMIDAPHTGSSVGIHKLWGTPSAIRRPAPDPTAGPAAGPATGPARAASIGPYGDLFATAGARYGVDPALLSAIARTESDYNPGAVSSAGAQGLMQLMPGTASQLGVNPYDPTQAVDGAARMMRDLLQQFNGRQDLAVAAYNAGPGAVRRYGGIPPYAETQSYVTKVLAAQEELR